MQSTESRHAFRALGVISSSAFATFFEPHMMASCEDSVNLKAQQAKLKERFGAFV